MTGIHQALCGSGIVNVKALDISGAAADSNSFSFATQGTGCDGLFVSPGGTRAIVGISSINAAAQYNLSSAEDLSTASYSGNQFVFTTQLTNVLSFAMTADGLRLFAQSSAEVIYQYNLSSAFDLSTMSYSGSSFSVAANSTNALSIALSPTGHRMFIFDNTADSVDQYNMSTPGELSSISYSGTFSVSAQMTEGFSMAFTADGKDLIVVGNLSTTHQYTLSTPFEISSASYASKTTTQFPSSDGTIINQTNTKIFADNGVNGIARYSI